jgi:hypothetical protein
MPKQKDLKRVIRTRMQKTGESYTAARMHIVKKEEKPAYAAVAGMSDASIKKGSGREWSEWVKVLDAYGNKEHRLMAEHISSLGVPGWWTQTVVVGYERIRGLRARGQRRSGTWEASKSKTFSVPVARLFKAWSEAKTRKKWLPEKVTVRSTSSPKSMRMTWEDGRTVSLWFTDKGAKSAVAVQHVGLASKEEADRLKKFWAQRLNALADVL